MSAPKRVLHIAHGITSYNNSLIALTRRLQNAGIDVQVASHVDLAAVLAPVEVGFTPLIADRKVLGKLGKAKRDIQPYLPLRRWLKSLQLNRRFREQSLTLKELPELVDQLQPDLLLIDMECHAAIIKLYKQPIRIVLCSRWFTVFWTSGVPPLHTVQQPADSKLESLDITLAWWRLRVYKEWLDWRHRFSRKRFWPIGYGSIQRYDLECLARQTSLSLAAISDRSQWLIPHVYTDLPIVSMTIKELEFGEHLDERMHYVGALVNSETQSDRRAVEGQLRFDAFIQRTDRPANKPLVYCSFSTFWSTEGAHIQSLIEVFAHRSDWDVVIGLGGFEGAVDTAGLPSNILLMDYAPQVAVIREADVVVTHGGISTINEALSQGVPLLVCNAGHVDQPGCTARVIYHGVGLSTSSNTVQSEEIEVLLGQLIGENGRPIRDRARATQEIFKRYENNDELMRVIEQWLD